MMNTSLLPLSDYRRYGRQMILEGVGLPGENLIIEVGLTHINDKVN